MSVKHTRTLRRFLLKRISLYAFEEPASRNRFLLALIIGLVGGICLAQFSESPEIKYSCVSQKSLQKYSENPFQNNAHEKRNGDNSTIADKLKKEVRILCWVMTHPKNHILRAIHVKRTWGKRCNILLFISSAEDSELPTVKLDVADGRKNLWLKVKKAFKYVYKHHYNDADWFYKADDDTYAVVENLRYMLYPYNPETPVYFGFKMKVKEDIFMSGGPGYVLSREALRLLVEEGIPNPNICLPGTVIDEDIEIGRCMHNLNVTAGDSRDSRGRIRMHTFMPEEHLAPMKFLKDYWYWSYQYYKNDDGLDCCSDLAISWHYMPPSLMYLMEYLIYNLKTYGLVRKLESLPAKLKVGKLLPAPIDEPADSNEDSIDDEDRLHGIVSSTTVNWNSSRWQLKQLTLDS